MARNTDRFMAQQHERRMERQGQGGLSARAQRRAEEAEQRRAQERAEREAEREARATGFNSGGIVSGRLSGMDRAIRYAQMYSAVPHRPDAYIVGVDLSRDPNAGLSLTEEDRVYHRERSRIIHEIMDARYMRGHSNMSFEDTIVRLARELVALEDEHARAEAQKQRRSALGVERRLGLDDFETGCKKRRDP
jgi:hypothetical protein